MKPFICILLMLALGVTPAFAGRVVVVVFSMTDNSGKSVDRVATAFRKTTITKIMEVFSPLDSRQCRYFACEDTVLATDGNGGKYVKYPVATIRSIGDSLVVVNPDSSMNWTNIATYDIQYSK